MVSCSKTKISKAIDNSVAIVWLETVKKEQREEIGSFIEGQDVFQRAIKSPTAAVCYHWFLRPASSIVVCDSPLTYASSAH